MVHLFRSSHSPSLSQSVFFSLLSLLPPQGLIQGGGGGVDWVSSHPPRGMKCRQKEMSPRRKFLTGSVYIRARKYSLACTLHTGGGTPPSPSPCPNACCTSLRSVTPALNFLDQPLLPPSLPIFNPPSLLSLSPSPSPYLSLPHSLSLPLPLY